jgi:hypothetical protein
MEIDMKQVQQVLETHTNGTVTGRELLLAGINMALQRIVTARGVAIVEDVCEASPS